MNRHLEVPVRETGTTSTKQYFSHTVQFPRLPVVSGTRCLPSCQLTLSRICSRAASSGCILFRQVACLIHGRLQRNQTKNGIFLPEGPEQTVDKSNADDGTSNVPDVWLRNLKNFMTGGIPYSERHKRSISTDHSGGLVSQRTIQLCQNLSRSLDLKLDNNSWCQFN